MSNAVVRHSVWSLLFSVSLFFFEPCKAFSQIDTAQVIEKLYSSGADIRRHDPNSAIEIGYQILTLSTGNYACTGKWKAHNLIGVAHKEKWELLKAIRSFDECLSIALYCRDSVNQAKTYLNLANAYRRAQRYISAFQSAESGLNALPKAGPPGFNAYSLKNKLLNCKGIALLRTGQLIKAKETLLEALRIKKTLDAKPASLGASYLNLGILESTSKQYFLAMENFKQADSLYSMAGDPYQVALAVKNQGSIYHHWGKYKKAREYYERAIQIIKNAGLDSYIPGLQSNIGLSYLDQQMPDEAIFFLKAALSPSVHKSSTSTDPASEAFQLLPQLHFNLGEAYFYKEEYSLALAHFQASLSLYEQSGNLFILPKGYEQLADVYQALGQFEDANAARTKSKKLSDSIEVKLDSLQTQRILSQERENQRLIREKVLREVKAEQERMELVASRKDLQVRFLVIGFFLLAGNFFLIYRGQRIKSRALKRKLADAEEKSRLEAELRQKNEEVRVTMRDTQTQTEQRISKDLHDELGSKLTAIQLKLKSLGGKISMVEQHVQEQFSECLFLVDNVQGEVQRIIKQVYPDSLRKGGIVPALQERVDHFHDSDKTSIQFISHGSKEKWWMVLSPAVQHSIYKIASELLNNIVKHANAKEAYVQFLEHSEDHQVQLMVSDDGIGFDLQEAKVRAGNGLVNLESRVADLKGKLTIDSVPNKGTTIYIDIPKQ